MSKGPRDRDPLCLTARKLAGQPVFQSAEAEPAQPLPRTSQRLRAVGPGQQQRQRGVLRRGQLADQQALLEDEAELVPAQRAALGLAELVDAVSVQRYLALVRTQDPGQHVQQRRLPRAGWSDDRQHFAGADVQVYAS